MQIRKAIKICITVHLRNLDPYLRKKHELKNMLRKTQIYKDQLLGGHTVKTAPKLEWANWPTTQVTKR